MTGLCIPQSIIGANTRFPYACAWSRCFDGVKTSIHRFSSFLQQNSKSIHSRTRTWFKRDILVDCVVMRTATSCEPLRSTAYSDDLRWKVVWQREALTLSCEEVARNLCIDRSTVRCLVPLPGWQVPGWGRGSVLVSVHRNGGRRIPQ